MQRRLAAIMAADVVGYSSLMGSDEAGYCPLSKLCVQRFLIPQLQDITGASSS